MGIPIRELTLRVAIVRIVTTTARVFSNLSADVAMIWHLANPWVYDTGGVGFDMNFKFKNNHQHIFESTVSRNDYDYDDGGGGGGGGDDGDYGECEMNIFYYGATSVCIIYNIQN